MLRTSGLKILCYHSIDKSNSLMSVTPSLFQKQMEFLKRKGYKVISLYEALHCLKKKGRTANQSTVVLTFDDGFRSFYTDAFPILKTLGFRATVFLVPGYMDGTASWIQRDFNDIFPDNGNQSQHLEDLLPRSRALFENRFPYFHTLPQDRLISVIKGIFPSINLPILTWDEVREMSEHGIDFEAHSYSHPFLTELSPIDAQEDISRSKAEIEKRLKKPVYFFCYPYGAANSAIKNIVKDLGFSGACSTQQGINNLENYDLYELKRISIDPGCGLFKFRLYQSALYNHYSLWKSGDSIVRSSYPQ